MLYSPLARHWTKHFTFRPHDNLLETGVIIIPALRATGWDAGQPRHRGLQDSGVSTDSGAQRLSPRRSSVSAVLLWAPDCTSQSPEIQRLGKLLKTLSVKTEWRE